MKIKKNMLKVFLEEVNNIYSLKNQPLINTCYLRYRTSCLNSSTRYPRTTILEPCSMIREIEIEINHKKSLPNAMIY